MLLTKHKTTATEEVV